MVRRPERHTPIIGIPVFDDERIRDRLGTEHTVSGWLDSTLECPEPLSGKELYLRVWYLLPDFQGWKVPVKRHNWGRYGYDRLVRGRHDLQQGLSVASTTIGEDGRFALMWKEVIPPDRTPYIPDVYHVSEDTLDPFSPGGFKRITVRKSYALSMFFKSDSNQANYLVNFVPDVSLEFYGQETEKGLPPLTAICIYAPDG
jgi:hypothetical protein